MNKATPVFPKCHFDHHKVELSIDHGTTTTSPPDEGNDDSGQGTFG